MSNEPIQNLVEKSKNLDFDMIIRVGEEPDIKEFKVHSIVLSASSCYFEAALSSRWARRENGIIIFNKPNISPLVFETIINHIYTGKFSDMSKVSLLDVFIAADEMELTKICQQIKKSLLETKSAWKFPKDFITIFQNNLVWIYSIQMTKNRFSRWRKLTAGPFYVDVSI
ncbi:20015_t:CDS:2, partial [Cetraspora pellucida]